MESIISLDSILDITNLPLIETEGSTQDTIVPVLLDSEIIFELGAWLAGIASFADIANHLLSDESRAKAASHNWTAEFRLTQAALRNCSKLTFQIIYARRKQSDLNYTDQSSSSFSALRALNEVSIEELLALAATLKEAILLGEALSRSAPLKLAEWKIWSDTLNDKFKQSVAFEKIIQIADDGAGEFLPKVLKVSLERHNLSTVYKSDIKEVLFRIARILKSLDVIGKMIAEDRPLKPALLIYARVYEQIRGLMNFINQKLHHFPDDSDEIFGMLDGVSYVASIELRKVYQQELAGLTETRPAPIVRAKIEASHGLLNDSFQQTLYGFARFLNPTIDLYELFPRFRVRYEETLLLRGSLWQLLQAVQQVEHNPEDDLMNGLNKRLKEFTQTTMHFLMYKDWETFERFVEEVIRTSNKQDLVPILHRFGAYIETLFGQVNMRSVVAEHPFGYGKE